MTQKHDTTLTFIKIGRVITYIVYVFTIIAILSLTFGFFFLLFSANPATPFVQFVYKIANEFLQPFRGIFPSHPVGETGYFSASALFAIIFYLLFATGVSALVSYLNLKMATHEKELNKLIK